MSIKVTSWVWDNAPAKGTELLLLLALADQANDDGECFMLHATIARKGRVHGDTVDRQLKRLISTGQVERIPRPGRSNVYRVVMHPPAKCTPPQTAGESPFDPPTIDPPTPPQAAPPTPLQMTPPYPNHQPLLNQPTNEPPVLGSSGALLAKTLVGGLPDQLKTRTSAGALIRRCTELAADGWTVETITSWTAEQDWGGARSGALVSARLRDLGAPPAAKPLAAGCPKCISGWIPDDHELPSTFPCPTCRPEIAQRLKEAR